jgi:hypothetical protein
MAADWEMSKDIGSGSSQSAGRSSLIYLRYTYHYRNQFGEPDGEWLDTIEATNDELLGVFTKREDEAMNAAFGSRGRRLNRVLMPLGLCGRTSQCIRPTYRCPCPEDLGQPCRCT